MRDKKIIVEKDDALLNILVGVYSELSKKKIKSLIKYKEVLVNGKVIVNSSTTIKKGSTVEVTFGRKIIDETALDIIYEDKDIIVIDKPAGLLSISNKKEHEETAFRKVSDYIKIYNPKARLFVVHRLDQATSGVLMFAKNERIKEQLQSKWNELVKLREYIAVVEGKVEEEKTIEGYLTMNHFQVVHSTHDKVNGWYAKTHFVRIKTNGKYSLIRVDIATGKRNQIRAHMSEEGHPIVGDKKYDAKSNPIGRLGLHASRLELTDPRNGKILKFSSATPKMIEELIK